MYKKNCLMFLQILLASILFQASYAADNCSPYTILGIDEFIKESEIIQNEGKKGIYKLLNKPVNELSNDVFSNYKDVVAEGDILNISVYHPTRTDWTYSLYNFIQQKGGIEVIEGNVTIPGFEAVRIVGMTLREAREELKSFIRKEMNDVDVFLTFRVKNLNTVVLCGKVLADVIPVDGKVKLFEILSRAHIFPDANLFASYVLRDGQPLSVDLYRLLKEGDMAQNIVMRGGDKIFIASSEDHFAVIVGEVATRRPLLSGYFAFRGVPLPTGFVSIREALVQASGIMYSGCKYHFNIIRKSSGTPKIFVISWSDLDNQPSKNLLLIPGDLVYLTMKPINNWKVAIDDLEPTLMAIASSVALYRATK